MADDTATWKQGSYTELDRRLARKREAQTRRAQESLAAQGALYSGARQAREREVQQDIDEQWHMGAQSIEDRAEQARQAELLREQQRYLQSQGFGQEQTMAGLQHGYGLETLGAQHGYTMEQMGGQFGYEQQLQQQAEQAQRQLASDKAYYQSYLQAQVQAGAMTELQAQQDFAAYSQQADQQYGYAMEMAQQQYGYGMQQQQGEWNAYLDTLGYQNQAGLMGMQQGYDWQSQMADQQFQFGMQDLGWYYDQERFRWQKQLTQMGLNGQYHLQHLANDAGSWTDALGAVGTAVGAIAGGPVGAAIGGAIGGAASGGLVNGGVQFTPSGNYNPYIPGGG